MTRNVGRQVIERSETGIRGLDDVLSGGFIPHRLYLVDGDPGSGKTTLSVQYLLRGVSRGEKCLYVTLSETKEELIATADSHGWSLEGIEIVELIADEQDLDLSKQITMYHPSEVELTETTRKVLAAVERLNPAPWYLILSRKCGCLHKVRSDTAGRFLR